MAVRLKSMYILACTSLGHLLTGEEKIGLLIIDNMKQKKETLKSVIYWSPDDAVV